MSEFAGLYSVERTDGKIRTYHAKHMESDEDSLTIYRDDEGSPVVTFLLHSIREVTFWPDVPRADNKYSVNLDRDSE